MSSIYDNWERLVAAVLRREQLWHMFHDRSPSTSSISSEFSSDSQLPDVSLDFWSAGGSSPYHQPPLDGLTFFKNFDPTFDLQDLLKSPAELLGKGTFATTYRTVINSVMTIVVKRLKKEKIQEKEFRQHMEVIGIVRHENVSALRAYCLYRDEKLILYDHHSSGSLSAMLHGKTRDNRCHLDWETRLRIAVGAARGIAHIHMQSGGKLIHGNIKSSNIFLNAQQYGCVSDLGMSNMIAKPVMKTARYHAPEVKNTRNVSQASDVYSFGILLLELLTRKSTSEVREGEDEAVDLVKLVNSINSKERTSTKVFDVELLRNPMIKEHMVKALHMAMSCVTKTAKRRPKMSDVVKMLEDIMMINTGNRQRMETEQQKLAFINDCDITFNIFELLAASSVMIGKGRLGTSYMVTFNNGITIVAKRLRDVTLTSKEFQQQMDVIDRTRHGNITALKAYYCSSSGHLMLCDYHDQGSLYDIRFATGTDLCTEFCTD